MRDYFRSRRFIAVVCVIAALLAGVIAGAVTSSRSSPVSNVADIVYSPAQKLAQKLSEALRSFRSNFNSSATIAEELSEQVSRNDVLQRQLADYDRLRQQMDSYEAILGVAENHPDYVFMPATVITSDRTASVYTLTIDKGSLDGVEKNDPVVSGDAVVGAVLRVNSTTSVVRTILDTSLNISAYEIRTRENGYVNTTTELSASGGIRFSGLTRETAVTPGGTVMTSGLGGIFPRDLRLGVVTEVRSSDTDVSVVAELTPAADVNSVSNVFVITAFD